MQKQKGFTLIEMLAVVAIVGILASVTTASLSGARERARDSTRLSDMDSIRTALDLFYEDHGHYPGPIESVSTSPGEIIGRGDDIDTALQPYINPVPKDPRDDGTEDIDSYYYAYDPYHMTDTLGTCDTELGSGGDGLGETAVAFGFNRAESSGFVGYHETCSGGNKRIGTTGDYNRIMFPASGP